MSVIHNGGSSQRIETASYDKTLRSAKEAIQPSVRGLETREAAKTSGTAEERAKFDVSRLTDDEKEKLDAELQKLNESIASSGKILKFKYNEEAKASYVEVIDAATQEVVVSLPPEFLIDLSIKMKELIGMFIDKKL